MAFLFGACIGSFLNVCIYRIPLQESIVTPRSRCPHCGNAVRFYDNIPILSYLLLMARCRQCGAAISIRYPVVELITGLCALATVIRYGLSIQALVYFCFIAVLILITYIDLDHQIIPNQITLPGIPIFLSATLALPEPTLLESLAGIAAGGGSLLLVGWTYRLITKREGMGGGDVKLLAMIGALTGWKGVLFTIYIASAVGACAGLIVMLASKKNFRLAIPFGPFLAIGSILYLFYGKAIIGWYFNVF